MSVGVNTELSLRVLEGRADCEVDVCVPVECISEVEDALE